MRNTLRGSRLLAAGLIAACTAISASVATGTAADASTAARASTSAHASTTAHARTTAASPARRGPSPAQIAMLGQQTKWAARAEASHTSVITGSVAGFAGQSVSGVCVTAIGSAGSTTVAAGANGTFRLAGLAAGSYALEYRACAAGGRYQTVWSGGAASQSTAAHYQVGVGQVRHVPVVTLKSTNPAADVAAAQASFQRKLAANSRNVSAAAAAKTGEITGEVTGKGKPLGGICVSVYPVGRGRGYGAKTGKNGVYTVRHVAPGSFHVVFAPFYQCPSRGNWLQQVYNGDNQPDAIFGNHGTDVHVRAGHKTSGINGALRLGGEISGVVTSKSGATQRGICLFASGNLGHRQYDYSYGKTAANGSYQLHALFPGKYTLHFSIGCGSRGNYAPATNPAVKLGLGQDLTVNEVLATGASISGKVTLGSSSGTALKGICVYDSGRVYTFASTDSNGDYRLIGLLAGTYHLYFQPGCRNNGNYTSTSLTAQTTAGQPTTGVNAVLQVGGEISGTVTDTHGKPVSHVCIELNGSGNYTANVPYRTGKDGTYVIDQLSAGTYQVGFVSGCGNSGSYAPNWYDNQASENTATPINIAIGTTSTTFTANAVMQPAATITGRVTDASGHGLSGICVDAVTQSFSGVYFSFGSYARTHNGTYRLSGLAPGQYLIQFGCGFGGRYAGQWFPDAPDAGLAHAVSAPAGLTSGINAVLQPGGVISGVVTNKAGHELEGVCAFAMNTKGTLPALRGPIFDSLFGFARPGQLSITGPHGSYKITGLAAGRYHVLFSSCFGQRYAEQWYSGKASASAATPVTVRTGKTTPAIDGQLVLGGTISGHVMNASGKSLADICVIAVDAAGDEGATITGGAGTYSIRGLGSGSYTVEFAPCGSRNLVTVTEPATVTAPGVTSGIDATMHSGGSIAGVVTAGSAPVSFSCVEAYSTGSAEPAGFGFTGLDGSYSMTGLAAGTYQVYFGDPQCDLAAPGLAPQWYNGQTTRATATSVTVAVGATKGSVNAALQPDGQITGTVSTGSPATALSGACVTAFPVSANGSLPVVAETGTSGYTLSGLLPGQYEVRFSSGCGAAGYTTQWWKGAPSQNAATIITVTAGTDVSGITATLSKG